MLTSRCIFSCDTVIRRSVDPGCGPSPTFDASALNGPGSQAIALEVCDGDDCGTDTSFVTILNVAPTANADGPYDVDEGSSVLLSGSATDPGTLDVLSGRQRVSLGFVVDDAMMADFRSQLESRRLTLDEDAEAACSPW